MYILEFIKIYSPLKWEVFKEDEKTKENGGVLKPFVYLSLQVQNTNILREADYL